jgi:hypothetical protein
MHIKGGGGLQHTQPTNRVVWPAPAPTHGMHTSHAHLLSTAALAPLPSSARTTSACPFRQAQCRGVLPPLLVASAFCVCGGGGGRQQCQQSGGGVEASAAAQCVAAAWHVSHHAWQTAPSRSSSSSSGVCHAPRPPPAAGARCRGARWRSPCAALRRARAAGKHSWWWRSELTSPRTPNDRAVRVTALRHPTAHAPVRPALSMPSSCTRCSASAAATSSASP